ncbi:hypothetical protein, partial [Staphylococcus pasteuri_A]
PLNKDVDTKVDKDTDGGEEAIETPKDDVVIDEPKIDTEAPVSDAPEGDEKPESDSDSIEKEIQSLLGKLSAA